MSRDREVSLSRRRKYSSLDPEHVPSRDSRYLVRDLQKDHEVSGVLGIGEPIEIYRGASGYCKLRSVWSRVFVARSRRFEVEVKAAIIPPIPHLSSVIDREFHLLLSHLLLSNSPISSSYRSFYHRVRQAHPEAFLILDNSAHECGEGEGISNILSLGQVLQVNEIVVPDILFDRDGTVQSARQSFEYLKIFGADLFLSFKPRLMIVPQGKSRSDLLRCARSLSSLAQTFRQEFEQEYSYRPELTLGVSKDYEVFDGDLQRVVSEIILPISQDLCTDVHVLGWGHNLWGHRLLGESFGGEIRSTDSAKPWVYAQSGIGLDSHYLDIPTYPKRRDDYFSSTLSDHHAHLAHQNIEIFDACCRGELVR